MTYRMRGSPPSPEISPASSSTDASKCKHHRKTHQGNRHNDDDYAADYSPSQSPYELEEEEEDEQPMNTDDAASYNQSESGTPDECPVTHLSRFTKVCRANNAASIEMMMRIFPITLENEAALWYDLNIEPYASLSWEEIKSSFMEAYRRNELVDQFRSELMMINQGGKETSIRAARRKDLKCGFCDGPHKELGCEIREKMRGLWLKSNEKALTVCSARIESDVAAKELVRSLSMGTSSVVGKQDNVEDEKEEGGMLGWKKKSQCQCWKHQCWKKKFERNNSLVTGNSNAG
ncbi:hypothetical protein L1049_024626 [Liquidambar formosana]|uniref:Retrotransposon gag domain-containing protein n=1 Tax=Liquidambar formosana TaxID=63359 RepID=A0AAP0RW24_LIQFO